MKYLYHLRLFLIIFTNCCIISPFLSAQSYINGMVQNKAGEGLPFVNVIINNDNRNGITTDINGEFKLEFNQSIKQLSFSYLGYKDLTVKAPFKKKLTITLESTAYEMEEITIIAGENPAHRIINKAIENRGLNDPENLEGYSCTTYNKVAVGYNNKPEDLEKFFEKKDSSKKRIKKYFKKIKRFHQFTEDHHILMLETLSKRSYSKPNNLKEEIILNHLAGSQKLPITALATGTQPFSFYKEEIMILEEAYLNPISKNSTKRYFFNITDTLYHQQDTVFVISFHPRKGSNFNALEGTLYINTNRFAIQNVIAKSTKDRLIQFEIAQRYKWTNNQQWFPEQLLFELETGTIKKVFASIKSYGRTFISDVQINPPFAKDKFENEEVVIFRDNAVTKEDSIWQIHRKEGLSEKEKETFTFLDSLGAAKKIDTWISFFEKLGHNRIDLKILDFNIENAFKINKYEGLRLGIGLSTNQALSKKVEFGGYYAYGFRDKEWKYGLNTTWFLDKNRDNRIDLIYKRDLSTPAAPSYLESGGLLNFDQFSDLRDDLIYTGIRFQSYPIKYFRFNLAFSQQEQRAKYDYQFLLDGAKQDFKFAEMKMQFRYAYNERFFRFLGHRISEDAAYPILELSYIRGFDNIWKGQWAYNKVLFSINHSFRKKMLGKTSYRLEAGFIDKAVPFSKLFSSFGLGRGFDLLNVSHAFQTMDFYEFLSDRFIHLFFRHDFSSLLFKTKKFKPGIVLEHNVGIGNLRNKDLHSGLDFKTLEKGYFEVGLVVENLIRIKYMDLAYVGFGLGTYLRYGPYRFEENTDNLALRLKLSLSY